MACKFWRVHTLYGSYTVGEVAFLRDPGRVFKYEYSFWQITNEKVRSSKISGDFHRSTVLSWYLNVDSV